MLLLVIGAAVLVPALTFASWLAVADKDPQGVEIPLALFLAGMGACVSAVGGAAVYIAGKQ